MVKKFHYIFLGIFCVTLIGLQINSSPWLRLKLADFYKGNRQYVKTMQLYNKILTKNTVKRYLGEETFSKINFDLGCLYAKLDLTNLAIESYAKGGARFLHGGINNYYFGDDLEKDKLLAIGLLEAGRWDKGIEEFRRLKQLYSQSDDTEKYINTAVALKEKNLTPDNKNFYFAIGDAYIQNQLFVEARAYFSKRILDYGIDQLQVLSYLQKRYSKNIEVKKKVWGDYIYVTLEDFESLEPRLSRSAALEREVNNHYITKENVYRGNHSEFLDIPYYNQQGPDSWVKIIKLPLSNTDLDLGIRLFIKNINPSINILLGIEAAYPKQGTTGISLASVKQDIGGGWEEHRMEHLFGKAEGMAKATRNNWETEGMSIGKLILAIWAGSNASSNKFYIDEIELYLL